MIDPLDDVEKELQVQRLDLEELAQSQAGKEYVQIIKSLGSRAQRRGRVLEGIMRGLTIEV